MNIFHQYECLGAGRKTRQRISKYKIRFGVLFILFSSLIVGCNKMVQIQPPTSSITTSEVFADSADASAALMGVYASIASTGTNISVADGAISIYTGSSADELINFQNDPQATQIYTNSISANNSAEIDNFYWTPAYSIIYEANACIEGAKSSTGLTQVQKNQIIGEAEFCRSLINFYLVNLFGDIPLLTSTDYKSNSLAARTPSA